MHQCFDFPIKITDVTVAPQPVSREHAPVLRATLFLPHYWPTWVGLGCLRMIEWLPSQTMMQVGCLFGRLVKQMPVRYVRIARRNIELCLPHLSQAQRETLVEKHFESLGMGLCETAMTWWSGDQRILKRSSIEGLEHLEAALAKGRGVIVLTAHFTTLEIAGRILNSVKPINVLYRPPKNEVMAAIVHHGRNGRARRAIPREDIRSVVRALKLNEIVWYAPDQSYRKKGAAMVPFFGIPAATNTYTSRLARMTGATVLPFSHERVAHGEGWKITIHPPLEGFPSEDVEADAARYHRFIEAEVNRIPEQYWWIHRRFKGLSADYPDYYSAAR